MIRRLHRRLALLFIGIVAIILCAAACAALLVSERQMARREQSAFDAQLDGLAQQLRMQKTIADVQIARLEAEHNLIISIFDNDTPIAFPGAWVPSTPRQSLVDAAMADARQNGLRFERADMLDGLRCTGELRGGRGERYLSGAVCIRDYRDAHALVLLQDMRPQDAQRAALRRSFAAIVVVALAALCVFGWFFTRWMLRPIEAAHHKQNEFIAAASHEIRTPLSVIQTGIDALRAHPPDMDRFLSQIQAQSNRIAGLTGDLLLLTALRLPTRAELPDPVEPGVLLRDAQRTHADIACAKSVSIRVSAAEPLPLVAADARRLERALFALVDNAIEYAPPGGDVELRAFHRGNAVYLCVQDDGPGIAPEQQARMFERFYRGTEGAEDRPHSGLGLCIAREIVEAHGGKLEYRPVSPHGSLFTIRLPCPPRGR